MIPINKLDLSKGIEKVKYPSFTYKLHREKDRILSYIDEIEAVRQMVYKALSTERYNYAIYDHNYGFELDDLFGQDKEYVKSELIRRITECLMQDDRVVSVEDFDFPTPKDRSKTTVCVEFTVVSIYGDIIISKDVQI